MAYREPRFQNRLGIGRNDEILFEAVNEATCWIKVCKKDCINVSLHPAQLTTSSDCTPPFEKCAPIPSCETYVPLVQKCIEALDTKVVGTGSCIVIERKIGSGRDCGATEVCRWDFTKNPTEPVDGKEVVQWADEMLAGRDGFFRLRVLRYDDCPVYARFHVSRVDMSVLVKAGCHSC